MSRSTTDSGWTLQRKVEIRMTPWGVFRWGLLAGAPVWGLLGWIIGRLMGP